MEAGKIIDGYLASTLKRPDAAAIEYGFRSYSYGDIFSHALSISDAICSASTGDDDVVGILSCKAPQLVAAMIAAGISRRAFFVLDASYPLARLTELCQAARPSVVVFDRLFRDAAAKLNEGLPVCKFLEFEALAPFQSSATFDRKKCSELVLAAPANKIAYLLFTSGTTGMPKCIEIGHEPLLHFISWYKNEFSPNEKDLFSMLSGIGHDPILRDIFVPFSVGAKICIPPADVLSKARLGFDWIKSSKITFAHMTPQMARITFDGRAQDEMLDELRYVIFGGDILTSSHVSTLRAVAPNVAVVNFYGSSETPQAMGFHVVPSDQIDPIPIGSGIEGVRLEVLDDIYSACPNEVSGQICITTKYLAQGYRFDPELSLAKFVRPFSGCVDGERSYLTGDYGYRRSDGQIVIVGRVDDQVKIRGFRVELNEVNLAICHLENVVAAVTLAFIGADGENRLVSFVVCEVVEVGNQGAIINGLRLTLKVKFPSYCIPSNFYILEKLPVTPNGKIDRAALQQIYLKSLNSDGRDVIFDLPLIKELLEASGAVSANPEDRFIDLGADSLSSIRAAMALESHLGREPEGWECMQLRELAGLQKSEQGRHSKIDSTIVLRAISILSVLTGHFKIFELNGGTTLLFFLAGWSIGKYQIEKIVEQKSPWILLNNFLYIALPTLVFNLFIYLRYLDDGAWSALLMYSNFNEYALIYGYWFINTILQSILIIALVLSLPRFIRALRVDSFSAFWGAMLVCMLVALSDFILASELSKFTPVQKLWIIFAGIAFSLVKSRSQRLLVLVVIPFFGFDLYHVHGYSLFPVLAIVFMMFVPKIYLPKLLHRLASSFAGASLFIYLAHIRVKGMVDRTDLQGAKFVYLVGAIAAGVLMWRIWDRLYDPIKLKLRRIIEKGAQRESSE